MRSLEAGEERSGGPLVVILPGLGVLGYLQDTLAGCGAWARSFLLDVPGGDGPGACPVEVPALAGTVSAWLDALPDGPVVLAGHSTGAQLALRVAAARPDRVRGLALLGPVFPPHLRRPAALLAPVLRDLSRESPALLRVAVPYYLYDGVPRLARYVRSAQREEPERLVTGIGCPVIAARGRHDTLAPQWWTDRLAALAPQGRSLTVPGAHTFPYRRGGLTAALIARAARGTGVRPGGR
ncbi:alpha/beta fold hydrolase [Planobispora takensis]|uniref:AB hydrolase-1 domain-containing protein n=1 Tax=Planobispora takensis TaxID=1367882 RepID=A0A8J3X067_9ACTN|nr:alpha/beta hydrolase [Planobispora takensis]GII05437.1 hypothetical protein Pta02_74450 [Planobispora takensis]